MPALGRVLNEAEVASYFLPNAIKSGDTTQSLHLLDLGANPNAPSDEETPIFIQQTSIGVLNKLRRVRPVICLAISTGNHVVLKRLLQSGADVSTKARSQKNDIPAQYKIPLILFLIQMQLYPSLFIPFDFSFILLMLPIEGYLYLTSQKRPINPRPLQVGKRILMAYLFLLHVHGRHFPKNPLFTTLLYSRSLLAYTLRRLLLGLIILFKVFVYTWAEACYPPPGVQALLALLKYQGDAERMALDLLPHLDLGNPDEFHGLTHMLLTWAVARNYPRVLELLAIKGVGPALHHLEMRPRGPFELIRAVFSDNGNGEVLALVLGMNIWWDQGKTNTPANPVLLPRSPMPWHMEPLRDPTGHLPLVVAAAGGYVEIVEQLLRSGVYSGDEPESSGRHTLDDALIYCIGNCTSQARLHMVELLLSSGASPNATNTQGRSALSLACEFEASSILVIPLLSRGAAATIGSTDTQRQRQTALHHAVWRPGSNGMVIVSALLEAGAPIDALDEEGRTPLWYAANRGETEMVRLLVAEGAVVDLRGYLPSSSLSSQEGLASSMQWTSTPMVPQATTPLMEAARHGSLPKVRTLLEGGADPNASLGGDTAMSLILAGARPQDYAAAEGREELIHLLVEFGAVKFELMGEGNRSLINEEIRYGEAEECH